MEERITQTSAYLRAQMAIESPKKLHHFRVFTTFWAYHVPVEASLIASEITAFEEMEAADLSFSYVQDERICIFVKGNPRHAWDTLVSHATFKEAPTLLFVPFLDYMKHAQDWQEMVQWLRRLSSFYQGKRHLEVDVYVSYWKLVVAELPEAELTCGSR
jgi:hypothetical protein